uniref:MFS transporter n=1 Tax=Penicillium lilacinoechinulatum TaxID=451136 RepID=A9Q1F7_9EURO|nr:MFS transporter [Penicillium lilacinoechinulatum]
MAMFGLSEIQKALHFNSSDLNWVLVTYTLTFATILSFGGELADRMGLRPTFLVGTFMLFWTNILILWTPNKNGLLAGRTLAGVGVALTCATGISVIRLAIYVSCGPIGTVLGVILGALLTASSVGWRSILWVNFILAGISCILGFLIIPNFNGGNAHGFNYFGMATFMAGTCLLIYGLNDAEYLGWRHAAIIVNLILGGLLLIAFPFVERKTRNLHHPHTLLREYFAHTAFFDRVTWFFLATEICLNSLHYRTQLGACYFPVRMP